VGGTSRGLSKRVHSANVLANSSATPVSTTAAVSASAATQSTSVTSATTGAHTTATAAASTTTTAGTGSTEDLGSLVSATPAAPVPTTVVTATGEEIDIAEDASHDDDDDIKSMVAVKVVKNRPAYLNQGFVEIQILELLNQQIDARDEHRLARLTDYFVFRNHLCLVFELLSINLYELIKQNQFRGVSLRLTRTFVSQVSARVDLWWWGSSFSV
jgi:hypothetical protein